MKCQEKQKEMQKVLDSKIAGDNTALILQEKVITEVSYKTTRSDKTLSPY